MKRCVSLFLAVSLLLPSVPVQAAGEVTPNENLVVDGIPKIPSTIAEGVSRYTEFRSAGFLDWHPTRREMLISTRFGDTNQVHMVKFPGGDRKQMTFFPDRVQGGSFAPQHKNYFIFGKDTGGNEFSQLYRYDLVDGTITLITDGKSRNSGGAWAKDKDLIAYSSTRRNGKDTDIYILNPLAPQNDRLLLQVESGGWRAQSWSPDGKTLLVQEYVSINESYLWLVDTNTGTKSLLTPKGATQISYDGGEFSADGKGIYTASDEGSEFTRLLYIPIASKKPVVLSNGIPWDVETFELSPDGKHLAFTTNEAGVSVLHLLDTKTNKEVKLPKLPVGVIGGVKWHSNNRDLAFNFTSARSVPDVYSLDIKTGKIDRWTESETGGLVTTNFAEAQLIQWPSFDKRTISGFYYRPDPTKFPGKRPVIIDIHGGPEGQSRPTFQGRNNYYLNTLGIARIYPNVRGSTGYGKTFLKLDNGFLREDSVKDIGALLDWIKTQPDLDADRIMVTGGSYGGYMTLATATNYNDKIRCALDVVGISNFVSFLERTESYRRDLRRVEYGDERDPAMRAFQLKISPTTNAAKITKPLFVVQGKNDPRVPLNEAEQMVATVKTNGSPVWYLMAKDEGHGFAKKKNQDYQFYATVTFIQQYLLP